MNNSSHTTHERLWADVLEFYTLATQNNEAICFHIFCLQPFLAAVAAREVLSRLFPCFPRAFNV